MKESPPGNLQEEGPGAARRHYWMISCHGEAEKNPLTLDDGGNRTLPVFSHKEEAEMFLGLRGSGDGWRVHERSSAEIVLMLYDPRAGVRNVALDPLPEMVAERTVGLVSVCRKRFAERLMAGHGPLKIREHGSAPREDLPPDGTGRQGPAPGSWSTARTARRRPRYG